MQPVMRFSFRPRCVVLGLDGLPLTLARDLAEAGLLPNLAPFILGDKAWAMQAELPELSPVNWTSFFTAAGPGEHGVFGFTRLHPYDYSTLLASFADVRVPTIFDRLAGQGLVSRVINLPNAYPARPWRPVPPAGQAAPLPAAAEAVSRSALVAGFLAPDLAGAVWPSALLPEIQAMDYRLEPDTVRGGFEPELLLAEIRASLAGRVRLLDRLWRDLDFDCFAFVLTETDRLFHFLFPALVEADHPLRADCLDVMRAVDRAAGALLERFHDLPEPRRLFILADHGFTTLRTEVDLNAWLRQTGLLRAPLQADENDARALDAADRVFALDPGRLHIHRKGRFSRGAVTPAEADRLLDDLTQGLLALTHEGEPVLEAVFRAADLYAGPALAQAPDLVCLARPGFDLKAKFNETAVFFRRHRQGAHLARDAFFHDSHGGRPLRLRDAGALVLDGFADHSLTRHAI